MEPDDIKHLSRLQKENARLRKLVVELLMDKAMLEEVLREDCGSTGPRPLQAQSKN